ncbi:unnamed protein product, partial [Dicrocoelium dendriticum]
MMSYLRLFCDRHLCIRWQPTLSGSLCILGNKPIFHVHEVFPPLMYVVLSNCDCRTQVLCSSLNLRLKRKLHSTRLSGDVKDGSAGLTVDGAALNNK